MHWDPQWVHNWDTVVPSCASPHLHIFLSCYILPHVRFLVCALLQARVASACQGLRAGSLLESKAAGWC